jgi:hypothetical protein
MDAYTLKEAGHTDAVEFSSDEFKALIVFLRTLTGEIDKDYIRVPALPAQSSADPSGR